MLRRPGALAWRCPPIVRRTPEDHRLEAGHERLEQGSADVVDDATAELGALTNPFGLMAEVFYTGDTATFPATASGTQANTWADVGNPLCP